MDIILRGKLKTGEKVGLALKENYIVRHFVLHSRDYGLPQCRGRVYILMFLIVDGMDEAVADHIVHVVKDVFAGVHRRATTYEIAQLFEKCPRHSIAFSNARVVVAVGSGSCSGNCSGKGSETASRWASPHSGVCPTLPACSLLSVRSTGFAPLGRGLCRGPCRGYRGGHCRGLRGGPCRGRCRGLCRST